MKRLLVLNFFLLKGVIIKTKTSDCPCINCLCIPVCRHKSYTVLFRQCKLLINYEENYLTRSERNHEKIFFIVKIIKPISWNCRYELDIKGHPINDKKHMPYIYTP